MMSNVIKAPKSAAIHVVRTRANQLGLDLFRVIDPQMMPWRERLELLALTKIIEDVRRGLGSAERRARKLEADKRYSEALADHGYFIIGAMGAGISMTTSELDARLLADIKRRALEARTDRSRQR